jgi:hypothetical protein
MSKKVIPFQAPSLSETEGTEQRRRIIFRIGGRRYALEFCSSVTELDPTRGQVITIQRNGARIGGVKQSTSD